MQLLRELLNISHETNKYRSCETHQTCVEDVNDTLDLGPDYVPLPKPASGKKTPSKSKNNKTNFPTTDAAQNSLVNTLWYYNNADAS